MANSFPASLMIRNDLLVRIDQIVLPAEPPVYEVLRIIGGVPLFWEDHYSRLVNSVKLSGFTIDLTQLEFRSRLKELIRSNEITEGNIKIDIYKIGNVQDFYFYFIPHKYPEITDYKNGVDVGILHGERKNPKAKVHQHGLREQANQIIKDKGFFEVLLVNNQMQLTEGSRTNVFFIQDSQFYTSPENLVLSGITRQKVVNCIIEMGERLSEKVITEAELANMDAVFLTGTSPKILPVKRVDDLIFSPKHEKLLKLIQTFDQYIESYLSSNKAIFCS